jgi:hypothetical protein
VNPYRRLLLQLALLPAVFTGLSPSLPAAGSPPAPPERDRAAILAMAGEYRVSFEFTESAALRSGYEAKPVKRSGGTELVIVVEDNPTRIVLQHLLLDTRSNTVIKHWRQDWTWQDAALLEFRGDRRWQRRELAGAEVAERWTQSVYEVDDSPRYAATGRWQHRGATSEWVSEETWRPLPRREHTTRDDYDVLVGINRHIVTPWGWVHAQDNTKLDLRRNPAEPLIAREIGTNTYRRITDVDFTAARDYWLRSAGYWAAVRAAWQQRLGRADVVAIDLDVDGVPIMNSLLDLADDASTPPAERERLAVNLIDSATQPIEQTAQR